MTTFSDAIKQLDSIGSKCRFVYRDGPHCEVIDKATSKPYVVHPPMDKPGSATEDDALFEAVPIALKATKPLTDGQLATAEMMKPVAEENDRLKKELDTLRRQLDERQTSKSSGKSPTSN